MERMKKCSICSETLPKTDYPKKDKQRCKSYCKNCRTLRNEMMKVKKIEIPKLVQGEEIEVRGKLANGHGYTYFVPYEKAVQMVDERVAYIVHERLIRKFFDSVAFRKLVFKRFGEICFYCGEFADTIDHIIPKSQGGLSSFANCVPACYKCNQVKNNMALDDFLFYFDPYSSIPEMSIFEYARHDLMKLADRLESYNNYLNMCLKKMDDSEKAFDISVELELLDEKMDQINGTISKHNKVENQKNLV